MSGRDTPLAVVPALAGSADLLGAFLDALPSTLGVMVMEPPGFGASASPEGLPSTRTLAHAVLAEWDRRGIARAHLFGISLGGMIAQWIAIDAPQRVERLVLASTTTRGLRALGDAGWRSLALARCLVLPDRTALLCLVNGVLAYASLDAGEARAIEAAALAHARSKSDLIWLARAAAAHDTDAEASAIRAPTLVLSGASDRLVAPESQACLVERIPDARQIVVPDAGHDLTLEAPSIVAGHVARFLAR